MSQWIFPCLPLWQALECILFISQEHDSFKNIYESAILFPFVHFYLNTMRRLLIVILAIEDLGKKKINKPEISAKQQVLLTKENKS